MRTRAVGRRRSLRLHDARCLGRSGRDRCGRPDDAADDGPLRQDAGLSCRAHAPAAACRYGRSARRGSHRVGQGRFQPLALQPSRVLFVLPLLDYRAAARRRRRRSDLALPRARADEPSDLHHGRDQHVASPLAGSRGEVLLSRRTGCRDLPLRLCASLRRNRHHQPQQNPRFSDRRRNLDARARWDHAERARTLLQDRRRPHALLHGRRLPGRLRGRVRHACVRAQDGGLPRDPAHCRPRGLELRTERHLTSRLAPAAALGDRRPHDDRRQRPCHPAVKREAHARVLLDRSLGLHARRRHRRPGRRLVHRQRNRGGPLLSARLRCLQHGRLRGARFG